MTNDAPVGVFDSGVGGLTVAKEIMRLMPSETIVYFGDTARVPYGSKSRETVLTYTRQIIKFLKTKEVKAIVIACNTASAFALETVKEELDIPVIGVVKPGAKTAVETTENRKIGIIGTEGTINSGVYTQYVNEIQPGVEVYTKPCPLFVPLVEEGMLDDPITVEIAKRYLKAIMECDIDTLVMGCTHYPLLSATLQAVVGEKVALVNPAFETAKKLKEVLESKGLLSAKQETAHRFFVSDGAEKFRAFANTILPCEVVETKDINIELY